MKIFELYDCIVCRSVSHHSSIKGAVLAMSEAVEKLAPSLQNDYGEDSKVDFELRYSVQSIEVREEAPQEGTEGARLLYLTALRSSMESGRRFMDVLGELALSWVKLKLEAEQDLEAAPEWDEIKVVLNDYTEYRRQDAEEGAT